MATSLLPAALGTETIIDRLWTNADRHPNKTAYTFLAGDLTESARLSFRELQDEVGRIGAGLIEAGVSGQRALLIYSPGLEFICGFLGCLYAGVVAVPVYPPRNNRSVERILSIAQDCQAAVALTSSQLYKQIERWRSEFQTLEALNWRVTDTACGDTALRRPKSDASDIAFLQYTSGSTGLPKGVMVSHGNIMHNQRAIQSAFHHSENDVVLGWLPVYHDMGLIGNVLQPLYVGASCILLAPTSFLQHPMRWLEAISKYRATTSGGPNFAYDLCARKIDDAQLEDIDLSTWTVAFCGAEPIRPSALEQFARKFTSCGFRAEALYPCYGLAEGTLIVSGNRHFEGVRTADVSRQELEIGLIDDPRDETDALPIVCCGPEVTDTSIAIVDPQTFHRCPANAIGEVWVSGPSVAQGYWNNDADTQRTFRARIDGESEQYLRTGDLGFVRDGELYVTGRLKDLLIIAGRNYYPQDIEAVAETAHPVFQLGASIAFAVEMDEYSELVIVQEIVRHYERYDLAAACLALRGAVSEQCGVGVTTVVLVRPSTLPKTSSGKVQRSACRQSYLDARLDQVYTWTLTGSLDDSQSNPSASPLSRPADEATSPEIANELLHLLARVLRVEVGLVESRMPTSSLGLDSMNAVELQHAIETRFGISLPTEFYLGETSLADLTAAVEEQVAQGRLVGYRDKTSSDTLDRPMPVTHGQSALWMLQQMRPRSTAYHLNGAACVEGEYISERLPAAIAAVIDRHPALRMTFAWRGGILTQITAGRKPEAVEVIDASRWDDEETAEVLRSVSAEPFDLRNGPVCRAKIFVRSASRGILHISVHHIVADFWSIIRVLQDLAAAVRGTSLPADDGFLRFLNDTPTWTEDSVSALYWTEQLASPLPVLNLPSTRSRPSAPSFRGKAVSLDLSVDQTAEISAFALRQRVTLFAVLLAAYFQFLADVSGQREHVVGVPVNGRTRAAFAESVGYFVNTLPIRVAIPEGDDAASLIRHVQERLYNALKHQSMPFPEMVRRIALKPDVSRNPVFQTMFTHLGSVPGTTANFASIAFGKPETVEVDGFALTPIRLGTTGAQCDLAFDSSLINGRLTLSARYSLDLFDSADAERFLAIYREVLLSMVRNHSTVRKAIDSTFEFRPSPGDDLKTTFLEH